MILLVNSLLAAVYDRTLKMCIFIIVIVIITT